MHQTGAHTNPFYIKLVTFLRGLTFYTPIVPIYFLDKGVSLSLIVLSQAAYSVAIILSEVPTGVLADKFGNKRSVTLGCFTEVLGIGIILVFPNVIGLFLGYVLMGIGESFQSGSTEALLYEGTKAEGNKRAYRRHLSQVLSNDTLAFALGTAVVGVAYGALGKPVLVPLIIATLLAKTTAFLLTFKLHEVNNPERLPDRKLWQTFKSGVNHLRSDSILTHLTYVKVLTLAAPYVMYSTYQAYFIGNGVSAYFVGFVLTLGALANAICMRQIHRIEKYFTLDKVILWFTLLMAITYTVFSFVENPWVLVLVFVLLQAQFNLQDPIVSDYVNDRTVSGVRATVLSSISLIRSIGNTVSKVLLGLSLTGFGVQGMLRIQAIYLFLGALVSYWLLVKCGCVYKLHEPTTEQEIVELETELAATRE